MFYVPIVALIFCCTAVTVAAMYQIQVIYTNSRAYDAARLLQLHSQSSDVKPPFMGAGHGQSHGGGEYRPPVNVSHMGLGGSSVGGSSLAPSMGRNHYLLSGEDTGTEDEIAWSTNASTSSKHYLAASGAVSAAIPILQSHTAGTTNTSSRPISYSEGSSSTIIGGMACSFETTGTGAGAGDEMGSARPSEADRAISTFSDHEDEDSLYHSTGEESRVRLLQARGSMGSTGSLTRRVGGVPHPAPQELPQDQPSNWILWLLYRNYSTAGQDDQSVSTLSHSNSNRLPDTALSVTASTLLATWRTHGRSIIFVSLFCLTGLYVTAVLFFIYYVQWDSAKGWVTEYIQCLVQSALSCHAIPLTQQAIDSCAFEACGAHPSPRPSQPLVSIHCLCVSEYIHVLTVCVCSCCPCCCGWEPSGSSLP